MSLESTVSVAKVGTNSVRATVPEGIVAFLDLKVGDKLVWKMDFRENERITTVTKKTSDLAPGKEEIDYSKPKRVKRHG